MRQGGEVAEEEEVVLSMRTRRGLVTRGHVSVSTRLS